jgi:hypothetical protein
MVLNCNSSRAAITNVLGSLVSMTRAWRNQELPGDRDQ